jgi:dihydropyrimidine dehydrogenase (NAD+) subunit PreA
LPISGIGGIKAWQDAVEFILLGATSLQVCTAVMHKGFGVVKAMTRGLETYMKEKGFGSIAEFSGKSVSAIKKWGELNLNYKVVACIHEEKCIHCGICYASCEDGCYQAIAWDKVPRGDYVAKFGEPKKARAEQAAPAMALSNVTGATTVAVMGVGAAQTAAVVPSSVSSAVTAGVSVASSTASAAVVSGPPIDVFTIKVDTCVGCNMCALACPVEGCITMEEVETGKPRMAWNDYQKLLASGEVEKIQPKRTGAALT